MIENDFLGKNVTDIDLFFLVLYNDFIRNGCKICTVFKQDQWSLLLSNT